MKSENIVISGMQLAIPDSDAKKGACREIINTRFRKGCWRPIPEKKVFKNWDVSEYDVVKLHHIDTTENMIGMKYSNGIATLWLITGTNLYSQIGGDIVSEHQPMIVFLKRALIVSSGSGVHTYFWIDGSYSELASLPVPDVQLSAYDPITAYNAVDANNGTEKSNTAAGVLGYYYKALNNESQNNGRMYGSIMYISAYRLFDGSYIIPSIPKYLAINNGGSLYHDNTGDSGTVNDDEWWIKFTLSKVQATINNELYPSDIGTIKELVDSVVVFATKPTTLHKIDESTLTDTLLKSFTSLETSRAFSAVFPVSDDYIKLAESSGWYKLYEFSFVDIVGKPGRLTKDVDAKGFYQNYATKEALPADQFSHHQLAAKFSYMYNDRLHLLNVKTILGSPYLYWPELIDNTPYTFAAGKLVVFLKSLNGNSTVVSDVSIPVYRATTFVEGSDFETQELAEANIDTLLGTVPDYAGDGKWTLIFTTSWVYRVTYSVYDGAATAKYILPAIIGYNDARAYKYQIVADDKLIFEQNLQKNTLMNFSFWVNPAFSVDQDSTTANYNPSELLVDSFALNDDYTPVAVSSMVFDTNRLQVSEVQNPIVFPAKNSYQIGNGECLAMAAGSEPISDGQFGQFPLQVFCSDGIFALEVGTGEVLYLKIVPVNGEVINNVNNVVSLSLGVCYTTSKGLYIVNGLQATELSEIVENDSFMLQIGSLSEITTLISNSLPNSKFVPALANSLSSVGFLEYLADSTIGYDHENKELIVTNNEYGYSYVYSIENQVWYKLAKSYKMLVNDYPKLHGVTETNIVSLSEEETNVFTDTLIITMAQNLEAKDVFKKIERAILRCRFTSGTNKYPGFYVFASNDLLKWQLITGKQRTGTKINDLLTQRSHGSAKAYMFVWAGNIDVQSEIKQIDLIYSERLSNKLR